MLTAFFDRDGTIAKDYPDEIWSDITNVELMPGAIEAMCFLRKRGYEIIIVSNQYLIEEGFITHAQYEFYARKLLDRLKSEGIEIKDVFYCPHARTTPCACRKPAPGMIEAAIQKYPDIDMKNAFMVGDSECDLLLAKNLHIPAYGIKCKIDYEKCVSMESLMDFERVFFEHNRNKTK